MNDHAPPGPSRPAPPHMAERTALLVLSILLLFPRILDSVTRGTWPRFVESLGAGRWIAWAACFVAMVLLRFGGGPKRGK